MKITFFSTKPYEVAFFEQANKNHHQLIFLTDRLTEHTAIKANGSDVVCCFVEDQLNQAVLTQLNNDGIKLIALRSSGFNHVDLQAAVTLKLTVVRVPSYSPHAIAEFALGMMLALSRKLIRGYERVQRHNFSLVGQMGFNLNNKTIGIVGTGAIGSVMAELLTGFGCTILAVDPLPNERCLALGVIYTTLEDLYQRSDIITLHCPLNAATHYLINAKTIAMMKNQVILINTARGELLDTAAAIDALKSKKIAALGLDVYEHEQGLFFEDHSDQIIQDDQFIRLQAFPNVLITGHQAYFTVEALTNIAQTTIENITNFERGIIQNQVVL